MIADNQKICLIHMSSAPGGIEVLLPEIIAGFPGKEFISFVIRPDIFNSPSVYNGLNHKVFHGSASNLIAVWKLFRFSRQENKAVFHVFNIGPFFLFILRLLRVSKLIYSIHGTVYWNNNKQKYLRKIFWWLAINRKEYRFTSNSEFSRKEFLDKIDPKVNIELLYNPINLKKFNFSETSSRELSKLKRIIYVGRLTEGKGLEQWIKCAAAIQKVYPSIKFEVYGEGPLRFLLQEEVLKIGANKFIRFKGHITDIEKVYGEANLLLFLSEYESFGNVVVESILCGTPVIATDIPGMKEIFINYPGFLISSEGDQVNAIMDKLKNYPLLKDLCYEAANEFRNRFSAEQHFKKLQQIYKQF
jgi:glycosyltransferase involved in cell wall biosynthesis